MNISAFESWAGEHKAPFVIAGPCSAESEEQLLETCQQIKSETDVQVMRAGVWKPRTRPNSFEGVGVEALKWIQTVKEELGVRFAIEVANGHHVYEALKHGVDILWVGARSTVNPFTVQEIADALRGVDVPVLVKNPINPDLALWMGGLERINQAGVTKLGAIHRGFSSFTKSKYRNMPMWQLPIELRRRVPELPIIGDPSHIAGDSSLIFEVCQQSMDLDYDGLMVETHRDPENAWSDAKQQVTPKELKKILSSLLVRNESSEDIEFTHHLQELREKIDHADHAILEAIAARMELAQKIGEYKKDNNVAVLQVNRWEQVLATRQDWGEQLKVDANFVTELYKLIHVESIKIQSEIMDRQTA